jgi:pilus assembly protein CpaB
MKPVFVALTSLALAAAPEPRPAAPIAVMPKARAYTVDTAAVTGGAVLRPNDHVDIVTVLQDDKRLVAVTLLQNVVVVANAAPAPGEARQLSLLVIPEEAELLALAKAAGHLTATLRNEQDLDVLEERGSVTVTSALTGQRLPPPKAPKK